MYKMIKVFSIFECGKENSGGRETGSGVHGGHVTSEIAKLPVHYVIL
jgi:hypothetical protein